MNYFYWNRYLAFIEWCDTTSIWAGETYLERHHIMPKSLGGDNSKDNLIKLPYRAHLLAHWMLAKAIPCSETWYAFHAMTFENGSRSINSRHKELVRHYNREASSEFWNTPEMKQFARERLAKQIETTDFLEKQKIGRDKWNSIPENRAMLTEAAIAWNSNPENIQKIKDGCYLKWEDKDWAEKRRQSNIAQWNTEEKKRNLKIQQQIGRITKKLEEGFYICRHGKFPLTKSQEEILIWKLVFYNLVLTAQIR